MTFKNNTFSEANESGLIFAKNTLTNQVETIATTTNMQIGLSNKPTNLTVNGTISIKTDDITIPAGSTHVIKSDIHFLGVKTTGTSGTVTLQLPTNFRKGQLLTIKDIDGSSATVSITISASPKLIDGSSTKVISQSYESSQLIWNGTEWLTISGGGGGVPAAGSDTQVQFNDGGTTLGAQAQFTYDKTNYSLNIGGARVGSYPVFPYNMAMFGHESLDVTTGNYAIAQENTGDTIINSPNDRYIRFKSQSGLFSLASIRWNSVSTQTELFFGTPFSLKCITSIGSRVRGSTTTIYGGHDSASVTAPSALAVPGIMLTAPATGIITIGSEGQIGEICVGNKLTEASQTIRIGFTDTPGAPADPSSTTTTVYIGSGDNGYSKNDIYIGNASTGTSGPGESATKISGDNIWIGSLAGIKIGFFGTAPTVRYSASTTTVGYTAGLGSNYVKDTSTFTGQYGYTAYTIGDIVRALKLYGLLNS